MSQKSNNCSEIISRVVAKQLNLTHFNTGKPCIRGHTNGRFTSTGKCIDCGRSASKLWRQINPEKAREWENNWRIANPEKVNAQKEIFKLARPNYHLEYYAGNKEKKATQSKKDRANNPWTYQRNSLNYQLRKKQVPGKLSAGIWYKLFLEQDGLCVYCKADLRYKASAIDHKEPISLGGPNTDENVQLLCVSCNCSKSNTPLKEYERKIGYVHQANGVLDVSKVQQLFLGHKMKYIVVSAIKPSKTPGQEPSVIRYPFVFPNNLVHAHVGKVLSLLISFMHISSDIKITSAGDVNSADFTGECSGRSESLGVKSAPGDTQLLAMNDYGSGMLEI